MTKPRQSIYRKASEWGVPFGLYLACAGVTTVFADMFPPLSVLFLILLLGIPLVVYYFQRLFFIEEDGFTEHAALWMLGIMIVLLGTVLASFIIFLVIQYGRPEFIYEQAQAALKAYSETPEMRDSEMLRVLQRMVDERLLPTPIEMVFNVFWFVTFGGCIISAITALIAQRPLPHRRSNNS